MHKPIVSAVLSLSLLLSACSSNTPQSVTPAAGSASLVASPEECAVFESTANVITRVDFNTDRDFIDIAKTFEPVGGTKAEKYVLLEVGKADFERLKVTAATRDWTVQIDKAATERFNGKSVNPLAITNYSCYRTVEETYSSAQNLASQYPNLASWTSIGPTWKKTRNQGGYDMYKLTLTNKNRGGIKPKLLVTTSIHAREYTPAELGTRFAEYLLSNYGKDADVTWMLDTQEVQLVLQSNPDGRKVAEAGQLWRKNVNNTSNCGNSSFGTDLNRNFAFHWNRGGSSADPCNETFRGPSAASEPETQNLQAVMRSAFTDQRGPNDGDAAPNDTMGVYVDVHSYSDLVLWPWGDTNNAPPNAAGLQSLGRKLAFFNGYTPEQAVGLYPTSGTTDDYAYGELGVASYTIELGSAFFEPCSNFTSTILPQNQAALLYALRVARAPYLLGGGADILNVNAPASVAAGSSFALSAAANNTRFNTSNGREPNRTIASAEYTIDTPFWEGGSAKPLSAADGAFNAATENISGSISTAGLSQGRHTVYIRAKNSAGGYGPVSAVFVSVGTTPPPSNTKTYTGSLNAVRASSYQPSTAGFSYAGGTLKGALAGPTGSGSDFDLYLEKLSGSAWSIVARGESPTNTENISYNAASGTYRWRVYSYAGSGSFSLTETK